MNLRLPLFNGTSLLAGQLRFELWQLTSVCGNVSLLLWIGFTSHSQLRITLLIISLALSFYAWLKSTKRFQLISSIPTATLGSAAQGYVELVGRAALLPGAAALGFTNTPPCVWYRYEVYRQDAGNYQLIDSGQSHETFALRDGQHECVIDPDLAEVITTNKHRGHRGIYHTRVEYIAPGERLYAIGELTTLTSAGSLDRNADICALLGEWKRDQNMLIERFDRNADGKIDMDEWQAARREAAKEVDKQHRHLHQQADVHLLKAPQDGRPFILANRNPDELIRHYQWWAYLQATTFIISFAWLGKTLL